MVKRVFIIHGWDGYPEEGWFPWLKKELVAKGFEVFVPAMPETSCPKIETWIPFLQKLVGEVDEQTYFVGHSIGCQAILRYLQTLPENKKVGGVVMVAGWVSMTPMSIRDEEEKRIVRPWLETPLDFAKIKNATNKITAFLSDNDPYVPPENGKIYQEKLGAKVIVEKGMGHFTGGDDKITELPNVLTEILKIAGE